MKRLENISEVVETGLCTSCGACVAVCPQQAVSMDETPSGLLFASVNQMQCNGCGLCLRICGGHQLLSDLLPKNDDPFKGHVLEAYCGYSCDPEIRDKGQSGGVTTAILSFMLESGKIDRALVTRMPEDGTLRPEPFFAAKKEDLIHCQGSKYCPTAVVAAMARYGNTCDGKMAIVGLPCQMHSIRNSQNLITKWKDNIVLTIGLFCDRTLAYGAIDFLLKGKANKDDVKIFRYRDKSLGGWPGSVYIQTKDGQRIYLPSRDRIAIKDFFTPPRCRLCFDKLNILSDISVGDAWGVREDKKGFSVILARTRASLELLKEAERSGYVQLEAINPEMIYIGQGIETRRKNWTAYSEAWREMQNNLPNVKIEKKYTAIIDSPDISMAKKQLAETVKMFKTKKREEFLSIVSLKLLMVRLLKKFKRGLLKKLTAFRSFANAKN